MTMPVRLSAHLSVILGSLAAASLLTGCSDIEVTSRYGPEAKLSGLGPAYSWAPASAPGQAERSLGGVELERFLRDLLEKQLAAKGFALTPQGPVDFWIDYRLAKREETDAGVVPHGEVCEEGSLILDVTNPKTGKLIWRGIAKARIDKSNPPEVRRQRLTNAVTAVMKAFPPK